MLKMILSTMFAAGCHAGMMTDFDAMRGYVEDTRLETARHLGATRAVTTMGEMRGEMTRHADGMAPMMSDIDDAITNMASHCGGAGMDNMRVMHGDLDLEVEQHDAIMTTIGTLSAAKTEVERHTGTTIEMMDGMSSAMSGTRCW